VQRKGDRERLPLDVEELNSFPLVCQQGQMAMGGETGRRHLSRISSLLRVTGVEFLTRFSCSIFGGDCQKTFRTEH